MENIIGGPYCLFEYFNDRDLVRIYLKDDDKSEHPSYRDHIGILGTGEVYKCVTLGNPSNPTNCMINALPITKYLQDEGFEFKYSLPLDKN